MPVAIEVSSCPHLDQFWRNEHGHRHYKRHYRLVAAAAMTEQQIRELIGGLPMFPKIGTPYSSDDDFCKLVSIDPTPTSHPFVWAVVARYSTDDDDVWPTVVICP